MAQPALHPLRRPRLLSLLGLLWVAFTACQTPTPVTPLEVSSFTPDGERPVAPSEPLTVVFDRPMVSPTMSGVVLPQSSAPLTIQPPHSGHFMWVGTQALVFIPDAPWPQDTLVEVTIPTTLRSVAGARLAAPRQARFQRRATSPGHQAGAAADAQLTSPPRRATPPKTDAATPRAGPTAAPPRTLSGDTAPVPDLHALARIDVERVLVLATRPSTGRALRRAQITLVDATGQPLDTAQTDRDGLAILQGARHWAPQAPRPWRVRVQQGGDEMTFAIGQTSLEGYLSAYRRDGVVPPEAQTVVHLFTDQARYAPGDTISFVGVVRVRPLHGAATMRPPEGDALQAAWHLRDSRHARLSGEDRLAPISPFGTFKGQVKLPWSAAPGHVKIVGTVPDANARTRGFSHRVEVIEATTPPSSEATLALKSAALVSGEPLEATLSIRHRAGFARPGVPVRWRVKRRAAPWRPEGLSGFEFGEARDGRRFSWSAHQHALHPGDVPEILAQGEGETDEEGVLRLRVDVPAQWRSPSDEREHSLRGHWRLTLEVVAQPDSAHPLVKTIEATVHPAQWNLGVALDTPWVHHGASFSATLVATALTGQRQQGVPLQVSLHALIAEGDKWRLDTQAADTCQLISASEPVACRLTPPRPGVYRFRARATDEGARSAHTERTVFALHAQDAQAHSGPSPHATLRLLTDRARVAPGETLQLLIQSPYPQARGLLTWEHNGVLAHQVLELSHPSAIVTLPITSSHAPQLHAAVALTPLPTPASTHPSNDPADVAHAAIAVPVEALAQSLRVRASNVHGASHDLNIEVTDPTGQGVSSELHLTVFTTRDLNPRDAARRRDTPAPLEARSWRDAFHTARAQGTALVASPVAATDPDLNPPSGEPTHHHSGAPVPAPERTPFSPTDHTAQDAFTTTTLSTHTLRTDAQGRASWRLPSSSPPAGASRHHLHIAAVDRSDRFGAHTLALPARPASSAHPDPDADEEATSAGTTPLSEPTTTHAHIRPLAPVVTLTPGTTTHALPTVEPSRSTGALRATFSASPRLETLDAALTLIQSPVGDTPTEAGRLLAATLYQDLIATDHPGLGPYQDLEHATGALLRREQRDGFTMLPEGAQSSLLATAHAAWALQTAKSHGLRLPKWALTRSTQKLHRALQSLATSPQPLSTQTHATLVLAALALSEARRPISRRALEALTLNDGALPHFAQAQLMATLALQDADAWGDTIARLRRALETAAVAAPTGRHISEERRGDLTALMHHPARTDAIALYALMRVDPEAPLARELFAHLMSTRNEQGHWGHPQAHTWIVAALHAYHRHYDLTRPDHSATLTMNERALTQVSLSARAPQRHVTLPASIASSMGEGATLRAELVGDSPLYMHLTTTTPATTMPDEFAITATPEAVAFQVSPIEPPSHDERESGSSERTGGASLWASVDVYVAVTTPAHHVTWSVTLPEGLTFEEATPSAARWWATRGAEGRLRLVVDELPVGVHRISVLARRDEGRP